MVKQHDAGVAIRAIAILAIAAIHADLRHGIVAGSEPDSARFEFVQKTDRLIVRLNGQPFGEYLHRHDKLTRPGWIHLHSSTGVQVTRNFPPRLPDDKGGLDHELMHPGVWISFGDLNGQDYWRLKAKTEHVEFVEKPVAKDGEARFAVRDHYLTEDGEGVVCEDVTRYTLIASRDGVWMLVDARFKSDDHDFYFGDQEESGLCFRVESKLRVSGGSGTIRNDRGETNGDEVWGKEAKWLDYSATLDGRQVGVMVAPDPDNPRPSWMHARDYGVVAVNPFPKQPQERREPYVKTHVKKGETYRLSYALLIHDQPARTLIDHTAVYRNALTILERPANRKANP